MNLPKGYGLIPTDEAQRKSFDDEVYRPLPKSNTVIDQFLTKYKGKLLGNGAGGGAGADSAAYYGLKGGFTNVENGLKVPGKDDLLITDVLGFNRKIVREDGWYAKNGIGRSNGNGNEESMAIDGANKVEVKKSALPLVKVITLKEDNLFPGMFSQFEGSSLLPKKLDTTQAIITFSY